MNWKRKCKFTLAALAAASTALALDPLEKADAYSTELSPELVPTRNFFPIGVLGDNAFRQMPFAGLNLGEEAHCCYEFKDGAVCNYKKTASGKGLRFFNVWAAHSIFLSPETKHYGTLKHPVNDAGVEYDHQMIRFFDPNTRKYVLDTAAATVDTVLAREEGKEDIFIWGIDNEFDEHHLETHGLEKVLGLRQQGVYTGIEVSPDDVWYNTEYGNVIRGDGKILYEPTTAKLLNERDLFENAKAALVLGNDFGKGRSFWFNTRLGALRPESVEPLVISNFLAGYLKQAGIQPDYTHSEAPGRPSPG